MFIINDLLNGTKYKFDLEIIIADVTKAINSVKYKSKETDKDGLLSLALDLLYNKIEQGNYSSKFEYFVHTHRSRLASERIPWDREMESVDIFSWDNHIKGKVQIEKNLSRIKKKIASTNSSLNPSKYANLLVKSGDLLIRLERFDEGIGEIIKSTELNPFYQNNHYIKFNLIGSAYARAEKWLEAVEYFKKSIEIITKIPFSKMFNPDYFTRYGQMIKTASEGVAAEFSILGAIFDTKLNNYEEAIKLYETAIRLCPNNDYKFSLHFNAGTCYGFLANFTKAISHLGDGIKHTPAVLHQYPYFAVALADIDRTEDGIKLLKKLDFLTSL